MLKALFYLHYLLCQILKLSIQTCSIASFAGPRYFRGSNSSGLFKTFLIAPVIAILQSVSINFSNSILILFRSHLMALPKLGYFPTIFINYILQFLRTDEEPCITKCVLGSSECIFNDMHS